MLCDTPPHLCSTMVQFCIATNYAILTSMVLVTMVICSTKQGSTVYVVDIETPDYILDKHTFMSAQEGSTYGFVFDICLSSASIQVGGAGTDRDPARHTGHRRLWKICHSRYVHTYICIYA